jgi:hypothetical protein
MNEIHLLPDDLQRKSLASNEIVLPYADALQALAILEEARWIVLGWEPWLKYPNGSHLHPLLGDSFEREDEEDWITSVQRNARRYREILKEEQSHWDHGTFPDHDPSLILYFCLTATNEEGWNELESRRL